MATTLHTFMDIFGTNFEIDDETTVSLEKIVIPIIQRDYAQGRTDVETERVRKRFLDSLYNAITEKPITLDFVYGDIDANGIMTPLDGQQRLTTLFLLHWYAAKSGKIDSDDYQFLKNFSYETRYSARDFCMYIVDFEPSFLVDISQEIEDQAWFPLDWKKDSTIKSMLVMLDAIHNKFCGVENLWQRLQEKAISFYFLPIKDMGLTDELYIKMNSRGKPLTQFEHFKAELEHELRKVDESTAKRILRKIDLEWTDMLWQYRGDDNVIDDEFLRYFRFICDIICYQSGGTTHGKAMNEFDIIKDYFSSENEDALNNIQTFEKFFDCWCEVEQKMAPKEFMAQFISLEHESGKIMIENKVDIFEDCLRNYSDVYGNGNRTFPLNRIIILYAFVEYLIHKNEVSEDEFRRRIRIIHNLVRNSEDEISDSEQRSSGNRMPAILRQTKYIILNGLINDEEENNYSSVQLAEEKEKIIWVDSHPTQAEALYTVEDHSLLKGQIAIMGLEKIDNYSRFISLFDCDWDLVDCALQVTGDYMQIDRNGWRCQLGSSKMEKAWITLFHKSTNNGFDNTKTVLCKLLESAESFDNEMLTKVKEDYLTACERDKVFSWQYYYVKYSTFRPGRYGKYTWEDKAKGFYDMHLLWTESKWSENSYQPFLFTADRKLISRDDLGHYSILGDNYIYCGNDAYYIYKIGTDEEVDQIDIKRNEDGIDMEDRIIKLKEYLKNR